VNKKTVTLFVVALNEIDGLKAIMPRIDKNWVDQILIVDGDSRDGTVEYAKENGYEIVVQKRKGLRWAYKEGFPHARGDYVITFSPDGNCPPEFIPNLIKKITGGNWDMVVASRYMPPAKSDDDDFMTAFGNKVFNMVCSTLHGYNYYDCLGMFRIYKTKVFYDLGLDKDEAYWMEKYCFTTLGVEPLLSTRAAKMKLRITEIPCNEPKRIYGIRKLQLFRWGSAYLLQMIFEAFTNKYRAK
jgi:glycosyltransferase involved in cell wall biosynthesis